MKTNPLVESNRVNQISQANINNHNNVIKFPCKTPKVAITDKYEKIHESYKYITRANGQRLNTQDKQILGLFLQITEKNGYAIIDYSWLEKKLDRSRSTVKRTLSNLDHIFVSEFHSSLSINGNQEFFKLMIIPTKNSQEILSNAKTELDKTRSKTNTGVFKNEQGGVQKWIPLYIYKEKITEEEKEEEALATSSSFSVVTKHACAREEISTEKLKMSEEKAFEPFEEAQAFSDINPVTILEKQKEIPKPMLEESSIVDLSTAKAENDYYKVKSHRIDPPSSLNDPLIIPEPIPITGAFERIISSLKIEENMTQDQLSGNSGILETIDEDDEPELSPIEQKLEIIENSHDTSQTMQLQRKIIGVFDAPTATKIIEDYDFKLIEPNKLQVIQKTNYQLSTNQKMLIRNEIKAVYGTNVQITLVVFQLGVESPKDSNYKETITEPPYPKGGEWEKIRRKLPDYLRRNGDPSSGETLVRAWFDKLRIEEDIESRKIKLYGSACYINYIKSNLQEGMVYCFQDYAPDLTFEFETQT